MRVRSNCRYLREGGELGPLVYQATWTLAVAKPARENPDPAKLVTVLVHEG